MMLYSRHSLLDFLRMEIYRYTWVDCCSKYTSKETVNLSLSGRKVWMPTKNLKGAKEGKSKNEKKQVRGHHVVRMKIDQRDLTIERAVRAKITRS